MGRAHVLKLGPILIIEMSSDPLHNECVIGEVTIVDCPVIPKDERAKVEDLLDSLRCPRQYHFSEVHFSQERLIWPESLKNRAIEP